MARPNTTFPASLPDGRHFLFLASSTQPEHDSVAYLASVGSSDRVRLFSSDSQVVYAAPGYLLYMLGNTLLARPFDAGSLRVTGEPIPIADQVERTTRKSPRRIYGLADWRAGVTDGSTKRNWSGSIAAAGASEPWVRLVTTAIRRSHPTGSGWLSEAWIRRQARGTSGRWNWIAAWHRDSPSIVARGHAGVVPGWQPDRFHVRPQWTGGLLSQVIERHRRRANVLQGRDSRSHPTCLVARRHLSPQPGCRRPVPWHDADLWRTADRPAIGQPVRCCRSNSMEPLLRALSRSAMAGVHVKRVRQVRRLCGMPFPSGRGKWPISVGAAPSRRGVPTGRSFSTWLRTDT